MNGSIDDLLMLEDEQFVDAAYQMLLHRAPDDDGRQYYLRRIRGGIDKSRLIYEIASGKEARLVCANVRGLRVLLQRQRYARNAVVRQLLIWRGLVEPDDWYARRLRSLGTRITQIGIIQAAGNGPQRSLKAPHVPGGVDPLDTWGVRLSLKYDANSPDVSWLGFSAPRQLGDRFLRWNLDPCAVIGFWWPHPIDTAELQLDIRTDGLLPLRVLVGSDVVFDHRIDIADGSIRMECSGLSRGFNEIRMMKVGRPATATNSTSALGLYAISFFSKE